MTRQDSLLVNSFVVWFLHRPAAPAIKRPAIEDWFDQARAAAQRTEGDDREAE
ncbi:hypothetical protein ACWGQ5_49255 [Streptomyces sp. NPDC055722]